MEYNISDNIVRTVRGQDVCLCCLATNAKFVRLSSCKHTSFFEVFFKFKFQYQKSVICLKCHHLLHKIESFKVQVRQSLCILWKKQTRSTLSKKFQDFGCTPIEHVTNIKDDWVEDDMPTDIDFVDMQDPDETDSDRKYNITAPDLDFDDADDNMLLEEFRPKRPRYDLTMEIKVEESVDEFDMAAMKTEADDDSRIEQDEQNKTDLNTNYIDVILEARTSMQQHKAMLEFMEKHGDLTVYRGTQGRIRAERLWDNLTFKLNAMPGRNMNADRWKKVWADWKCRTKKKAIQVRQEEASGNANRIGLSPLQKRVVAILAKNGEDGDKSLPGEGQPDSDTSDDEPADEETNARTEHQETDGRARASADQFLIMLEFMERHGDLAICHNHHERFKLWSELTSQLNEARGCSKSEEKWRKVWADWKSKTKKKALLAKGDLSPLENRVVCVINRALELFEPPADKAPAELDEFDKPSKSPEDVEFESDASDEENAADDDNMGGSDGELSKSYPETRVRSTTKQFIVMLEFMEQYGDLAIYQPGPSRQRADRLWTELTNKLNCEEELIKSEEKWRKVWADWKAKAKKKSLQPQSTLSSLEQRVLAVSGRAVEPDPNAEFERPVEVTTDPNKPPRYHIVVQSILPIDKTAEDANTNQEEGNASTNQEKLNSNIQMEERVRSTTKQFEIMLEFMEKHGDLSAYNNLTRRNADQLWIQLMEKLNNADGRGKTVEKWKKVWADWKSKTKKKARKSRNDLSAIEQRLIAVSGRGVKANSSLAERDEFDAPAASFRGRFMDSDASDADSDVAFADDDGFDDRMRRPGCDGRVRSSVKQFVKLLEFMERHGDLTAYHSMSRSKADQLWVKLMHKVNRADGHDKTVEKWKKVWADWKSKTKKKAIKGHSLTSIERRLVAISGRAGVHAKHPDDRDEYLKRSALKRATTGSGEDSDAAMMDDSFGYDDDSLPKTNGLDSRVRSNSKQFVMMLEFMERHGDLSIGHSFLARQRANRLWNELTEKLNTDGHKKSDDKWRKVWADWKSKTKRKSLSAQSELTPIEVRVMAISGKGEGEIPPPREEEELDKSKSPEDNESAVSEDEDKTSEGNSKGEIRLEMRKQCGTTQFTKMLEFMERHGDIGECQEPEKYEQLWAELVEQLNSSGDCTKTVDEWRRWWSARKTRTKRKMALINRNSRLKRVKNALHFNALDKRLMAIVDQPAPCVEELE